MPSNRELASPDLLGDRPIPLSAITAACALIEAEFPTPCTATEVWMAVDYAAARFERGEVAGALTTLSSSLELDHTAALRIAAVLHTTPA